MGQYKVKNTSIEGCFEIEPFIFRDERGEFIKIFNEEEFKSIGLCVNYEEQYYSVSRKGVLRGMHFQKPPNGHIKLVCCIEGKILDVVVDLRKESRTYGKHYSVELNSEKRNMLYVPSGLAHGFYSFTDKTIFLSLNSKKYSPDSESGIKWNSFDYKWPDSSPILSQKDKMLPGLNNYKSPF